MSKKTFDDRSIRQLAELIEGTKELRRFKTTELDFVAFDLVDTARAFGISILETMHLYASKVTVDKGLHHALFRALSKIDALCLEQIPGILEEYQRTPMIGVDVLESIRESGMLNTKKWRGVYDPGVEQKIKSFKTLHRIK